MLQSAHPAQSPAAPELPRTCTNPRRVTSRGCESATRMTAANVSHNGASACLCAPSAASTGTSSGRARGHDSATILPLRLQGAGDPSCSPLSLQSLSLHQWTEMGYLFGQKRRKVGRLQRQAARCFLVTQEASGVELGTWCWPRVVLVEKRPLTECERSSMNRAARSVAPAYDRQPHSAALRA